MQIKTYQSQADFTWLAHMNLGSELYMSFFGATEPEAIGRANAWFKAESERQRRIGGYEVEPKAYKSGSEHHFAGKMWVINRETHDLKRIEPSELAAFEANGYVRGGPRSK